MTTTTHLLINPALIALSGSLEPAMIVPCSIPRNTQIDVPARAVAGPRECSLLR